MNHSDSPLTHLLGRLPQAEPDTQRSARVQARCRKALARRATPAATRPARRLESLCIVGLCLAYLVTVIQQALQ